MTPRAIPFYLIAFMLCHAARAQSVNQNRTPANIAKLHIQLIKNGASEESEGWDAWVVEGVSRRLLPAQAIRESNGELLDYSNKLPYKPDFAISPDGQWIFATQKLWHTVAVGYLFRKKMGLDFVPASAVRFDEAAWRFYAQRSGIKAVKLPTLSDGERIIDFVGWSADSKSLTFKLRPVKIAKDAEWTGAYNVLAGRFSSPVRAGKR